MMDVEFAEMFSISFGDRTGTPCLPWGKDWHARHENALVTSHYNDKLVLDMEHAFQTMEGDSVTAPIHTMIKEG